MMIRKIACIGLILLILLACTSGAAAQNPFFSNKKQAPSPEPSIPAPPHPVFIKLAEAFGAQGIRAGALDELRVAIRKGFDTEGPTIIDVPVGEMPSPWHIYRPPRKRPVLK